MTNEKHFQKTISQWEFDYGLIRDLTRIVKFTDSSPSSVKLKRGILSWQKTYPNSETTCLIKLKFPVYLTPKELPPCKIFHICRCTFHSCISHIDVRLILLQIWREKVLPEKSTTSKSPALLGLSPFLSSDFIAFQCSAANAAKYWKLLK